MLQEINYDLVREMFTNGVPYKTLRLELDGYSIDGVSGSEISVALENADFGNYYLSVSQIGVPQLGTRRFFLIQPAITFENSEMRLRDALDKIATFTPILD